MRDDHTDERYVIVEQHDSGVGAFLIGLAIGAGAALLMAPRTGEDTRRIIERRARDASGKARHKFDDLATTVSEQFQELRERVEEELDDAATALRRRRRRVEHAVDAGKSAAHEAKRELERKLSTYRKEDDVLDAPQASDPTPNEA